MGLPERISKSLGEKYEPSNNDIGVLPNLRGVATFIESENCRKQGPALRPECRALGAFRHTEFLTICAQPSKSKKLEERNIQEGYEQQIPTQGILRLTPIELGAFNGSSIV